MLALNTLYEDEPSSNRLDPVQVNLFSPKQVFPSEASRNPLTHEHVKPP